MPNRDHLEGKAQTRVITTSLADQPPILIVQMEEPLQLHTRQRPEPAVALHALADHRGMIADLPTPAPHEATTATFRGLVPHGPVMGLACSEHVRRRRDPSRVTRRWMLALAVLSLVAACTSGAGGTEVSTVAVRLSGGPSAGELSFVPVGSIDAGGNDLPPAAPNSVLTPQGDGTAVGTPDDQTVAVND